MLRTRSAALVALATTAAIEISCLRRQYRHTTQAGSLAGNSRALSTTTTTTMGSTALLNTHRTVHTGSGNSSSSNNSNPSSSHVNTTTTSAADKAGGQQQQQQHMDDMKHAKSDLDKLESEWSHLQAEARMLNQADSDAASSSSSPSSSPPPVNITTTQSGGGDGGGAEPTLADLDRSIPQVDCEFVANLIRSRNLRRNTFLRRKAEVKARVEALTRATTKDVAEAVTLPRLGGLNFWRNGMAAMNGDEETSLAAQSAESPVLASDAALAQLTPEEMDTLQSTRPEYDDSFILLDCRTVNEVTSWGIIEGAKVLPAHELFDAFHSTPGEFMDEYGFPKPRPGEMIICYCQYGPRSLMAAQILSWMGYLKVLHFRDGYYEWGKQYNLLLRRWMEHDKSSGNELRRLATFRAALEVQREIAPEFNALPMLEASRYELDATRSRGTLLVGEGLRAEAYSAVATLIEGLPETKALPGHLEDSEQDATSRRGQHLTQFLEQATGYSPLAEFNSAESGFTVGEAQDKAIQSLTEGGTATGSPIGSAMR